MCDGIYTHVRRDVCKTCAIASSLDHNFYTRIRRITPGSLVFCEQHTHSLIFTLTERKYAHRAYCERYELKIA